MYNIKISEKTLKFGDIIVDKKDCHASKQAIALNLVNTDKIAIVSLIYDEKYTKTKIKAFNGVINAVFFRQ